jgi:hypothetical protein
LSLLLLFCLDTGGVLRTLLKMALTCPPWVAYQAEQVQQELVLCQRSKTKLKHHKTTSGCLHFNTVAAPSSPISCGFVKVCFVWQPMWKVRSKLENGILVKSIKLLMLNFEQRIFSTFRHCPGVHYKSEWMLPNTTPIKA